MAALKLKPEATALVLIDLQNGVMGRQLAPYAASDVAARCSQLSAALRPRGAIIVYCLVALEELLSLPVDSPTRDPNSPPPPASASELASGLDRAPQDLVITKRQWGAFYGTELDQQLRRRNVRTIVLGGVATNFGVESTARAAFDRGYEVVFAEHAMSTLSAEAHRFATTSIFPRMGRVRTTAEILEAIER